MAGRVQTEIRQTRSFGSLEQEAYISLLRTADGLEQGVAAQLKPYGLSPAQYNVLRILRGAGTAGLACREIGSRMITRDPDITRLLDRLETRRLIVRTREQKDRRVITTRITAGGLELLGALDEPVSRIHKEHLGHMGQQKLRQLIDLLEQAREKVR